MGRLPWLLADASMVAYALWTIACHATVLRGGNAHPGLTLSLAAVLAVASVVAWFGWRSGALRTYLADLDRETYESATGPAAPQRLGLAILAALVVWRCAGHFDPWFAWAATLSYFGLACWFIVRKGAATELVEAPATRPWQVAALLVTSLACAVMSLIIVRPRSDESFYSSMSEAVTRYPDLPLMASKLIHGPANELLGPQSMFPPYRVHSFEPLGGYLALWTGTAPANVVHLWLCTAFAAIAPLAIARLMRVLVPRYWLWATIVTVSYYFIDGTSGRGFANLGFVRFFNGKAVMLVVALPMICALGVRFARNPTAVGLIMLGLAQAMAVGLSGNAIWWAPVLAVTAVAAGTREPRQWLRTVPFGVLSTAYVLLVGAWVFSKLGTPPPVSVVTAGKAAVAEAARAGDSLGMFVVPDFEVVGRLFGKVFGSLFAGLWSVGLFALAVPLATTKTAWRLLAAIGLVTAVFCAPWLTEPVGRYLTGTPTYQRILWLLPIPVAVGVAAAGAYGWARTRLPAYLAVVAPMALLGLFYGVGTERLVVSERNMVKLVYPPELKVWPQAHAVAEKVCAMTPADRYVLAPIKISRQLPMVAGCAYPVLAAWRWMSGPNPTIHKRYALRRLTEEKRALSGDRYDDVIEQLRAYRVHTVVFNKVGMKNLSVVTAVRQAGFRPEAKRHGYHIWTYRKDRDVNEDLTTARRVCSTVEPGVTIMAPFNTAWHLRELGCVRVHPQSVADKTPADPKLSLRRLVTERRKLGKRARNNLNHRIDEDGIRGFVLNEQAGGARSLRNHLRKKGFQERKLPGEYRLFYRPPSPAPATDPAQPEGPAAPQASQETGAAPPHE